MAEKSDDRSRFRSSFTSVEGAASATFVEAKVVGVNMVNWTVDAYTSFDRKRYTDIQVATPYLHHNSGEGMYVMPDLNAKCMVCIPGDSSPPHVAYFLMAFENVDLATPEAPQGTTSQPNNEGTSAGASFAGGRPRAKAGDIIWRGRDGNFVILHRGGVLQIGSTELAQRMFIPLTNSIIDISDNYYHHTQGGTEYWGILPTSDETKTPTEYFQTFRLFAADKFADLRIKASKVSDPVDTPLNKDSALKDVVYEITVAPQGIDAESGAMKDSKATTFRFAFDKTGNLLLAGKGEMSIYMQKKITLRSDGEVTIQAGSSFNVKASSGAVIDGGSHTHIRGGVVKLGKGSSPVAHQGSLVQLTFPCTPVPLSPTPLVLYGTVLTGNSSVLV